MFRSPIVFKPYEGREAVATVLAAVAEVFEDFHYVAELEGEGEAGSPLWFSRHAWAIASSTASTC